MESTWNECWAYANAPMRSLARDRSSKVLVQVLVLYLERPDTQQCAATCSSGGALLIQRLEGSRPRWEKNGLCTLNGSDQGRRGCEGGSIGRSGRVQGRMERDIALRRFQVEAATIAGSAFRGRWDKGSACVPEHGQRARMGTEIHAAHRPVWGGERSRSCAAESRSTICIFPPQTGQVQSE